MSIQVDFDMFITSWLLRSNFDTNKNKMETNRPDTGEAVYDQKIPKIILKSLQDYLTSGS